MKKKLIPGCKIELRLTKNKLPIRKLKDLPTLTDKGLFSFVSVRKSNTALKMENIPWKTKVLAWAFQKRVSEVGFTQAKKEFNKNKNFEKTIGKFIGTSKIDLEKISQKKLRNYFKTTKKKEK